MSKKEWQEIKNVGSLAISIEHKGKIKAHENNNTSWDLIV